MSEVLDVLCDLVAIDSVNPALVPGGAGERAIAHAVVDVLRAAGVDAAAQEAAPGRWNAMGVLEAPRKGRTLLLCGHLDTVGVAGMERPFDPFVRDGRLYGRGAQDMKGGLAAMVVALCRLARAGRLTHGRLVLGAVADEEHGSLGADALVREVTADAAIVGEPTDLDLAVAHKGFAWLEVVTRGRAAHGSRPAEGRDAILDMGRLLQALAERDRALQAGPRHPLLGPASLHASLIEGGRELSTYPDRCVLQMERRTLPGEPPERPLEEVEAALHALRADDPAFAAEARLTFARPGYEMPAGHELPLRLAHALARHGRAARTTGASFWADSAILGGAGIPSLVWGPGGAGLHSVEEYVNVDEVEACEAVLREVAPAFCRGDAV